MMLTIVVFLCALINFIKTNNKIIILGTAASISDWKWLVTVLLRVDSFFLPDASGVARKLNCWRVNRVVMNVMWLIVYK